MWGTAACAAAVRVGSGVVPGVPADQVEGRGAHAQTGHGLRVVPGEHDPLGQGEGAGVAVPAGGEDLHGDGGAVGPGDVFHGVRLHGGGRESGLLVQLPADGVLQRGVLRLAAAAEQGPGPRFPDVRHVVPQVEQVAAGAVVDQRRGVHRPGPAVEPRLQQPGPQGGRADLGEGEPCGPRSRPFGVRRRFGVPVGELEDHAEVVVRAGRFTLGRARPGGADADVDGHAPVLGGVAEGGGRDPGLLPGPAQGRVQERAVVRLDGPARQAERAAGFVPDVQDAPAGVDHDRAARDAPGRGRPAGGTGRGVEGGQQVAQRVAFGGMSFEVGGDGVAEGGAGGRHVHLAVPGEGRLPEWPGSGPVTVVPGEVTRAGVVPRPRNSRPPQLS